MNPLSPLKAGDGNTATIPAELGDGGSNLTDTLRDILVKLAEESGRLSISVSHGDLAAAGTDIRALIFPFAYKVLSVSASAQTATSGTSSTVEVKKGGVTILAAPIDIQTDVPDPIDSVPDANEFAAGDFLTVELEQIGAGEITQAQVVLVIEKIGDSKLVQDAAE